MSEPADPPKSADTPESRGTSKWWRRLGGDVPSWISAVATVIGLLLGVAGGFAIRGTPEQSENQAAVAVAHIVSPSQGFAVKKSVAGEQVTGFVDGLPRNRTAWLANTFGDDEYYVDQKIPVDAHGAFSARTGDLTPAGDAPELTIVVIIADRSDDHLFSTKGMQTGFLNGLPKDAVVAASVTGQLR